MTGKDGHRRQDGQSDWEPSINALLDGELDDQDAERLKHAAEEDRELAQAIVQAWQLQRAMESLGVERAPRSLRKKLKRVPARENRAGRAGTGFWFRPAAASFAGAACLAIAMMLARPWEPSPAEVRQAEHELGVAFAYMDSVNELTARRIDSVVSRELRHGVTDVISRHLPSDIYQQSSVRSEDNS
jgi:ferric-dicitrate binding protein FerR (iron transport regulator)